MLHNVKDALPNGGLLIRPATIRVTVLPPIAARSIDNIRNACHELENTYAQLLGKSALASVPYALNCDTLPDSHRQTGREFADSHVA